MIGETIVDIEEHHEDEWLILIMKSGRKYKIQSHGYYAGEANLSWEKIKGKDKSK